jgi:glycerophosphoryl diester phosphodiesterase
MTISVSSNGHRAHLTAHKAILSGAHHGNTMGGIRECLSAGVSRLEIDVHSLADHDYAVFHERRLQHETTGEGSIGHATSDQIREARFLFDDNDRPPLLSEVVEAAAGSGVQLQLDLKDWRPMTAGRVRTLLDVIAPVHDQVIVTTGQDWNLLRLHRADPELAIGFDPGHYFDHAIEGSQMFLPKSFGAYGYRDDHPMAVGKTEDVRDYLRERWTMLTLQAPWAKEFFVSWLVMLQMLDDGFDLIAWLHERHIAVTAWTPDYASDDSVAALDRLLAAGVDRITTNTIPAWADAYATNGSAAAG